MSRIPPRPPEEVPELGDHFRTLESRMGFVPNSMYVMAHRPALVEAVTTLSRVVYAPDAKISLSLRNLVGHVASRTAGCMYCAAHTANNSVRSGVDDQKLAEVWDFETSERFTAPERAALRLAVAAGSIPNAVTDELMAEVAEYFDTEEIVELMTVIAWFGFLNRWNDSLATQLEEIPGNTAERTVAAGGWHPGKHRAD